MYDIGMKFGNDKITHHRYDLIYPIFLEKKRNLDLKILEIGLGDNESGTGKSNYFWKEYFPNSSLYIMDKDFEYEDVLSTVIKGDQSNIDDLEKVRKIVNSCDIIIDDGSHHPEHQIKTFIFLFDKVLKNGGTYIVEDIECNYWNSESKIYGYQVGHIKSIDFFMSKINDINGEFSKSKNNLNISSITFSKNCIIVTKQTNEEIEINKRGYRFNDMI
jgi:hypothetical protein